MNEQSITLPPGIDFREPGQLSPYRDKQSTDHPLRNLGSSAAAQSAAMNNILGGHGSIAGSAANQFERQMEALARGRGI